MRTFLFVVFFSIGTAALAGAILCEDLLRYYNDRGLLKEAQKSSSKLESLNADYDALLSQLEKDPNFVRRLAPATLGAGTDSDPNIIYPKAQAEQLAAAKETLMEDSNQQSNVDAIPGWLARCSKPGRRITLFVSGAVLILISFVWFGPAKKSG